MRELLEREAELRALAELVTRVRAGEGGVLLLEGVAGIGKTSLLAQARRLGADAGLAVRSATGGELERELPYGVAVQLLEADAASGDLQHGPARLASGVLRVEGAAEGLSEHATMHGLYWLVANLAEREPVLLCVDDLHWADEESVRWLSYLVRRLEGLPVGLVLTARPDVQGTHGGPLALLRAGAGTTTLRPAPLSTAASATTLAGELGAADDAVVSACFQATGGNPLLLHEVARSLKHLKTDRPVPADVARVAPDAVAASVYRRLAGLPVSATRLAEAVAVLGTTSVERAAAVAELDVDEATRAAADLSRAGLLAPATVLEFEHPVVRTTVYEQLAPAWRAQLHARAVDALLSRGADRGEIARHLLASPVDVRERHLPELLGAARDAVRRGAPDAAVRWLTAALLDVRGPQRPALLVELGRLEGTLGRPESVEHLRAACREAEDVTTRGVAALELTDLLTLGGRVGEVLGVVTAELLRDVSEVDAALALRLRAGLAPALFIAPLGDDGGPQAAGLRELTEPSGSTVPEREVLAALSMLAPTAAEASRLGRLAVGHGRLSFDQLPRPAILQFLMLHLTMCDELDLIETVVDTALGRARREASTLDLARFMFLRGVVAARRGDFARCVTEVSFVLETLEEQTLRLWPVANDSTLYRLAASMANRGDVQGAREAIARWRTRESGEDVAALQVAAQLVRLDIAEGQMAKALEQLRALLPVALTIPRFDVHYTGILTMAAPLLALDGQREEGLHAADTAYAAAVMWGAPRGLGVALTARGLTRQGEEGLADLAEACRVLDGTPARFELATALMELGAALRRSGRRADAREPLRQALDLAHRCGAQGLVDRATQELAATGARPRRLASRGLDALTPSELRVALMAAEGLGNVEIAQALFVSRKTVEKHLGQAFSKLDLHARSQLRHALAGDR